MELQAEYVGGLLKENRMRNTNERIKQQHSSIPLGSIYDPVDL